MSGSDPAHRRCLRGGFAAAAAGARRTELFALRGHGGGAAHDVTSATSPWMVSKGNRSKHR